MTSPKQRAQGVVTEFIPQDVDYQAAHWLAVLDGDKPSPEQVAAFHAWKLQDERHRKAFEDALELWGSANILTRLEPPARNAQSARGLWQRLWRLDAAGAGTLLPGRQRVGAVAVAAVLVVTLAVIKPWLGMGEQLYTTAIGEQQRIELPDGSHILLNTNSRLVVHYSPEQRRIALEQGEAHFDVAHDPERPFAVTSRHGRVKALGTAFTVRMADSAVSVFVTEGVVQISSAPPAVSAPALSAPPVGAGAGALVPAERRLVNVPKVEVSAGQQAVFGLDASPDVQVAQAANLDSKLSWHQGRLVFKGEALGGVIEEFSRYTATTIIVPSEAMRAIKVGGIFKIGDTAAMLDALEKGFGIRANYVADDIVYLEYTGQDKKNTKKSQANVGSFES